MRATTAPLRRSARLLSSAATPAANAAARPRSPPPSPSPPATRRPAKRRKPSPASTDADGDAELTFKHGTLSRKYETAKVDRGGYKVVVGCDEAGRGPLAGPVVAAACFVPLDVTIDGVFDSKKLTEPQREALFERLTTHPRVKYAVHVNSPQRIDEINILQASLEAMVKAVEALDVRADFAFIDGNRMPPTLQIPGETVVQGDSKVYSIAAASIIAKVTRDRIMVALDKQYPQYNLKQHKGYPTREHMAAIAKHGACEIHRMTFAPLKPKDAKPKPKAKAKAKQSKTTDAE
ncbi:hypothetical protein P43SY_001949 [Pythium insidiosum]|uniref:Ribonuclease n=1 Tax=Pythium insidiosum TaxID=114742 RepID=A0AAD5QCH1_PYTIN|nr:hypothetical protein P43SY_001949 [Pythium insidiosum]